MMATCFLSQLFPPASFGCSTSLPVSIHSSLKVVTDDGAQVGPFTLPDASTVYYFQVTVKAKTLHFETVSNSGGNTGAVEIEAYTEQLLDPVFTVQDGLRLPP